MTNLFNKKGAKNILSMALSAAVVFGFASCNNGDDLAVVNDGEVKTVMLKLEGGVPSSYAVSDPIANETVIELVSAYLYFVDGNGVIVDRYHFTGDTPHENGTKVYPIAAAAGSSSGGSALVLAEVPAKAVAAHFVGNPVTGVAAVNVDANISTVEALAVTVNSQGDVKRLNLYGKATLTQTGDPDSNTYACTIQPKPTVARIEVTGIANAPEQNEPPVGETDPPLFEPYKFAVEGVFVDQFYAAGTVAGGVTGALVGGGNTTELYVNSGTYPSGNNGLTHDWKGFGANGWVATGDPYKVTPATDKLWAYNLPVATTGSDVPRIVFRLGIEKDGTVADNYEQLGFVTVQGLTLGGVALDKILPGNIYRISTVNFRAGLEGGTTPIEPPVTPVPSVIDVTVTVTAAKWTVQSVEPIVSF